VSLAAKGWHSARRQPGQYLCKKIASTLGVACRRWMRIVGVEVVNNSQRIMRSMSASRMAREEER
jgi:hypothetical protein